MQFQIEAPVALKDQIIEQIDKENLQFELIESKGLDGAQILHFIVDYGPIAIQILNIIIDISKKRSASKLKITTDFED